MVDNTILEAIQGFCQAHVVPKIKLMAPNDDDVSQYNLMHPNVFVGWLPPPNQLEDVPVQLPDGMKKAIPAIVVGMDEGEDDGNEAGLNIRLNFIVYNPGHYPEPGVIIPNYRGYQDLLNLITICRRELSSQYLIGDGRTSAQKPFRWGMYQQQPVGYWVGWLSFRASTVTLPYLPKQDLLDF